MAGAAAPGPPQPYPSRALGCLHSPPSASWPCSYHSIFKKIQKAKGHNCPFHLSLKTSIKNDMEVWNCWVSDSVQLCLPPALLKSSPFMPQWDGRNYILLLFNWFPLIHIFSSCRVAIAFYFEYIHYFFASSLKLKCCSVATCGSSSEAQNAPGQQHTKPTESKRLLKPANMKCLWHIKAETTQFSGETSVTYDYSDKNYSLILFFLSARPILHCPEVLQPFYRRQKCTHLHQGPTTQLQKLDLHQIYLLRKCYIFTSQYRFESSSF